MFSVPCYYRKRNCSRQEPVERLIQDLAESFLGLRGYHPLFDTLHRYSQNDKNWSKNLRLRGFKPEDIHVSVIDDRKVKVTARRVSEDENGDSDTYESIRFIEIPQDVDVDQLSSRLKEQNILVIEGPYKKQQIPVTSGKSSLYPSDNKENGSESEIDETKKDKDDVKKDEMVLTQDKKDSFIDDNVDIERETKSHENETDERLDVTKGNDVEPEVQFPDSEIDEKDFEVVQNDILSNKEKEGTPAMFLLTDSVNKENHDNSNDVINADNNDDENEFKLHLDLGQFPSDDVNVVRKDSSLIVTAKKQDNRDGVSVSEQYVCEYSLPDDVNGDQLSCVKTSDGKLVVTGPYKSHAQNI